MILFITTNNIKVFVICRSWRLNERMYGALQGMTKNETSTKYGECQLHLWTKAYDIPPPALISTDPMLPEFDPRYAVSIIYLGSS